jgi:hypothetical protein
MKFSSLFAVMLGMEMVPVGGMRVMRGLLVVLRPVMLGGLTMVLGCRLVVMRRFFVMLGDLVSVLHGFSPPITAGATA